MDNIYTLRPSQAIEFLKACAEIKAPAFLVGPPGVGKSSLVAQFAQAVGARFPEPFIVSTVLPSDIRGVGVPDNQTQRLRYYMTRFFPPSDSQEKWVLFYDELTNADRRLQAPLQELILNGRVGDYHLPPGAYQVAAGNGDTDNCHTYQLSEALRDRFIFAKVEPHPGDWLEWGVKNHIHPDVLAFIKVKPEYLHYNLLGKKVEELGYVKPTNRGWHKVSDALYLQPPKDILEIIIAGKVGAQAAAMFLTTREQLRQMPDIDLFLKTAQADVAAAAKMVPRTTVGLWGLTFSLLSRIETIRQASDCLLVLAKVKKEPSLPVAEVLCLFMSNLVDKFSKQVAELAACPGVRANAELIDYVTAK